MLGETYLNENLHPTYNCIIISMLAWLLGWVLLTKCIIYFAINFYIKVLQKQ